MGVRNGQGRPTGMAAAGGESESEKSFYDSRAAGDPHGPDSFSGDRIQIERARQAGVIAEFSKRVHVGNEWESGGWAYGNYAREQCEQKNPPLMEVSAGHYSACWFWEEVSMENEPPRREE